MCDASSEKFLRRVYPNAAICTQRFYMKVETIFLSLSHSVVCRINKFIMHNDVTFSRWGGFNSLIAEDIGVRSLQDMQSISGIVLTTLNRE